MAVDVPRLVKAGRALTIQGVAVAKGDTLSVAQMQAIDLGVYLSNGWVVGVPDPAGQRTREGTPAPRYLSPKAQRVLFAGVSDFTVTKAVNTSGDGLTVTATAVGGDGPFVFSWGTTPASTSSPSGNVASKTYAAGTYTITATAANGDTATVSTGALSDLRPAPAFTFVDTLLSVAFTDTSTGSPTSWSWDFGDESALGTTQSPTHVYDEPGEYTVTLTATSSHGSRSVSHDVEVFDVPGAPTGVEGTDGTDGTAALEWVAPAEDGGSPITGYKIESAPGPAFDTWSVETADTGSDQVTADVACGAGDFKFRVSAITVKGTGAASTASATVTVTGP